MRRLLRCCVAVGLAVAAHGLQIPTPYARGESRLFLDTADEAEWRSLLPLGIFHGVTTNPMLLERAGVPCTVPAVQALAPTSLKIAEGDFVALVGPSGCGKSTILKMVGELLKPSTGHVFVAGREIGATPIRIEYKGGENPYEGKKNSLTARQVNKKRRLMSHHKKAEKKKKDKRR